MDRLWISAALLLASSATNAASFSSPADSVMALHHRLFTLSTPSLKASWLPTLAYEWQVRPRWSVRTAIGYDYESRASSYSYVNLNGELVSTSSCFSYKSLLANTTATYYLQAKKPALIGWFVGAGLSTGITHSDFRQESPVVSSRKGYDFLLRPLVRAGRHWALGPRWLLDTSVNVEFASGSTRILFLNSWFGLGLGRRF